MEKISIHPPRVGRDPGRCDLRIVPDISIHPPRVGRDDADFIADFKRTDFNPPSPCGEGPAIGRMRLREVRISIHPPRVGRDSKSSQKFFVNFCARR